MEEQKKSSALMWTVAVVVIALLAYGGYKYTNKETVTTTNEDLVVPPSQIVGGDHPDPDELPVQTPQPAAGSPQFKDGTYTAIGHYNSPGGAEQISITLTLKDDIITAATAKSIATRPETKNFQGQFVAGFALQVVGKKIGEVSLSKVSGSSLTPKGFNDAVLQIRIQSKA